MKVAFFYFMGWFWGCPPSAVGGFGVGLSACSDVPPGRHPWAAQGFLSVAASSRSPAAILGTFSLYGCIDRAARPYHFYPSAENHEEKRT